MRKILFLLTGILAFYACNSDPVAPRTGTLILNVSYTGRSTMQEDNVRIRLHREDTGMEEESRFIRDVGSHTFNLPAGTYILTLEGNRVRSDLIGIDRTYRVRIDPGEERNRAINIEFLPSSMVIRHDGIEFVSSYARRDTIRLGGAMALDIINRYSTNDLEWKIEAHPEPSWITFREISGTVPPGAGITRTIFFSINQDLLPNPGYNYADVVLTTIGEGHFSITVRTYSAGRRPTLTTNPITNQTTTSATFNGQITAPGTPAFTERGFVFGTRAQPTHANHVGRLTSPANNDPTFSANAVNLTPNTTYFVRAFAIQNGIPVYGNDVSFTTGGVPTTLSTSAVTNINVSSATLNGSITNVGAPAYTERGFVFSRTNPNPTIADNRRPVQGDFSLNITGLGLNQTYFVRAYAIQNGTPVYGNVVSFQTTFIPTSISTSAATNVTATTATLNAVIANSGTPTWTERGFVIGTSPMPTIGNDRRVVSGFTATYSLNITGLTQGVRYYVRAYAIQNGQPVYGNQISFTTTQPPRVLTGAPTNLTPRFFEWLIMDWNATFHGTVEFVGSPAYTARGFVWGQNANPVVGAFGTTTVTVGGTGAFTGTATGLPDFRILHVRAWVRVGNTYFYGDNRTFDTFSN